jgi:malonyl-CoA/methylmalonyl-CoA synthetase
VDGRLLRAEEVGERVELGAARLAAAGLAPGSRVVLCAGTSAALVCAYLAVLRAGLTAVPINPAYTEREVTRIVQAARPGAALVEDDRHARWFAPLTVSGLDLEELPGGGPAGPPPVPELEDPALLLYTSGTTGAPKGALLTHGNLVASARAVALAWRWTPGDRLLLALPLFHMHGLGVGLHGSLAAGGTVILRPGFDPRDVAERAAEGATMFFGVPAMYRRLAESGDALAQLRRLRLLVSGSAPLPAALAAEIADAVGEIPLERYGMTETVMLTSNLIDGERRAGKVGLPLPGVSLRLAPEDGEVQVRGPNVLRGYDGRPDADADAFTADGWFRTGDLGELDTDGHLRLVGRSKELIISGGFNVHPREVEEVVAEFPGVREVAVVGRPSARWGEAVTAVVVPDGRAAIDVEGLRAFAAERLAPYKVPKAVEFVDDLPRNALGKVVRGEL